ncbi:MAG TPA: MotA/TolQ/ExbB proton channel family protein [Eggerthellaceae bacterium]|nr:MotA/TolQ/ExbB proton channel family protein [Eggerthellaceae bacterium]
MDFVTTQTYLGDILRIVSDSLLGPTIVLLLAFIVYAVFCIGSILVEAVTEHRNFKVHMPQLLDALADADQGAIPGVVEESGLLNRQKLALLTVYDYRTLPGDMLVALVKRLMNEEEVRYQRIVNRNNVAVRVAPMLGLMGTLIPLGPGIAAMGQGDLGALSSSLIIAFNTTVAGLAAAAVCLVIARIRKTWYGSYMNALESAMASMLYKIGMLQDAGQISVSRPSSHAQAFRDALKRSSGTQAPAVQEQGVAAPAAPATAEAQS